MALLYPNKRVRRSLRQPKWWSTKTYCNLIEQTALPAYYFVISRIQSGTDEQIRNWDIDIYLNSLRYACAFSSNNPPPMKIALIDDHQILSDALKVNLMHSLPEIESIHHFNSFEPYAAVADDSIPTIVITELAFNGRYDKGVDAIFRLNLKNTQIIVLTSLTDDWLIRSYMRLGARAFLTKTCQYKELLEAITQVRKGNLFLSEHVQNILLTRIETGGISAESLSSVERAIMEALSQEEPLKSTAQKLKISLIELKYHRKMLMTRFNVRNFADLVELARRPGFFTESAAERSAVEHSV